MKKILLFNRKKIVFILFAAMTAALFLVLSRTILLKRNIKAFTTAGLSGIELSSSEYPYYTHTLPENVLNSFTRKKTYYYETGSVIQDMPVTGDYTIRFKYKDGITKVMRYNKLLGKYYDSNMTALILQPDFSEQLFLLFASLETGIYQKYGMLLPWERVEEIFPQFSYAEVIDIYTGKSFMVQRRAGSSHADVQPLTADDTAIMKEIFGGTWTWDRKGAILEIAGYRIAASMNGKPHGAGKLDDNNFPGHFCIHFLNSTTHSGNMDHRHQSEILKAAGKLPLEQQSE